MQVCFSYNRNSNIFLAISLCIVPASRIQQHGFVKLLGSLSMNLLNPFKVKVLKVYDPERLATYLIFLVCSYTNVDFVLIFLQKLKSSTLILIIVDYKTNVHM